MRDGTTIFRTGDDGIDLSSKLRESLDLAGSDTFIFVQAGEVAG